MHRRRDVCPRLNPAAWWGAFVLAAAAFGASARAELRVLLRHTGSGGGTLRAIAAAPTQLVAVGDGGMILTQRRGAAWTRQTIEGGTTLRSVVYSDGHSQPIYVAVGDAGTIVVSTDGDSWQRVGVPGMSARLNRVSAYAGRLFAAGEAGTILTSIDGRQWIPCVSGTTADLREIVRVNFSEVLAVSDDGQTWIGRDDGSNWRTEPRLVLPALDAIAPAQGALAGIRPFEWIGVGANGTLVTGTNRDDAGREFSTAPPNFPADLHAVAIGPNRIAAVGNRGAVALITVDQLPFGAWETLPSGVAADLFGVAFRRTEESRSFFAVGTEETILEIEDRNQAWLHNLAIRAGGGTGAEMLAGGFVIRGTGAKPVLIRAAGPALAQFSVPAPMPQPELTVFDERGGIVAHNAAWSSGPRAAELQAVARGLGAFAFPANSADSALLLDLPPGAYTAQVRDANGAPGVALLELYDGQTGAEASSRLLNFSARCVVGGGTALAIPGVTSLGNRAPRLLIRAIGPGLARFGVNGSLPDPKIEIVRPETHVSLVGGGIIIPAQTVLANDDWSRQDASVAAREAFVVGSMSELQAATTAAGAFPLEPQSRDAALLLTIRPGEYSIQVRSADNRTGVALIEVYDVTDL